MAVLLQTGRCASLLVHEGGASTSARCPPIVTRRRPALLASGSRGRPATVQTAAGAVASKSRGEVPAGQQPFTQQTVADVMTQGKLYAVKPDDTVDDALSILVNHKVTGLPVVDEKGFVVGVVSDFDLLALDSLGRTNDEELFPMADQTWQAFKEVKSMLAKTMGKKISDVMTKAPVVVRPETCLEDATRVLLRRKIRRLPVVDAEGKLIGILSRGNIVKAALAQRALEAPRCSLPVPEADAS